MNNIINYYYNLYPSDTKKYKDYYLFKVSNTFYMLYFVYEENKDLESIINILNNTSHRYHMIVYNKDNQIYTEYDKQKYMLLKLREPPSKIISFSELFYYPVESSCQWGNIWSKRIDYYEKQIDEIVENYTIKLSLQYYIGLAEIAISYYYIINNDLTIDKNNYSIQHKKMYNPVIACDYLNPMEMILDVNIRDIAEYIKNVFFTKTFNDYNLIINLRLNDYLANMLIIRLLYPSYFFDLYDDYIETKEEKKAIFDIMNKSKEYEVFLFKVYALLANKYKMLKLNSYFIY